MKKKGLLIVVSAPSGGGKGTVLKELFCRNENLKMSVSATTRAPRPGEEHGVHYYFIPKDEFRQNIENGAMLEYAEYCGNFYGTPKAPVQAWLDAGDDVVLEIEVQGGRQIKDAAPDCVSIFLLPPSLEVLEKRLRGRGTETEEVIQARLAAAREEIRHVVDYDYAVINDTVEQAVLDVEAILAAEKLRVSRDKDIVERILNHA
ncbi:MAG: guanylate kinase [Hominenteromicrobium sp.]